MPQRDKRLLVATANQGKLLEISTLMARLPIELCSLASFPGVNEVEETGATFDDNARLKASEYALQTGMITLADDSGLQVDALGGRPGVFSARYGGPETGFDKKMANLLAELDATGDRERRARFVAAIAVANDTGHVIHTGEGICPGRIALSPQGNGGFGYDPLFIPDGYGRTFGELPEVIKSKISHRARAFSQIIPFLRGFFAI